MIHVIQLITFQESISLLHPTNPSLSHSFTDITYITSSILIGSFSPHHHFQNLHRKSGTSFKIIIIISQNQPLFAAFLCSVIAIGFLVFIFIQKNNTEILKPKGSRVRSFCLDLHCTVLCHFHCTMRSLQFQSISISLLLLHSCFSSALLTSSDINPPYPKAILVSH